MIKQLVKGDMDTIDLNKEYEKYGFHGALRLIKDNLDYGEVVQVEPGLYEITPTNLGDDEYVLREVQGLISIFRENHYVGRLENGAYYYAENSADVPIARITVHESLMGEEKHMDKHTTIEELTDMIIDYRKEGRLDVLDSVDELCKAVSIEAGELLETTLFPKEKVFSDTINKPAIERELADVLIYAISLADYIDADVEDIITKKIEYNKKRGRRYDV